MSKLQLPWMDHAPLAVAVATVVGVALGNNALRAVAAQVLDLLAAGRAPILEGGHVAAHQLLAMTATTFYSSSSSMREMTAELGDGGDIT